MANILITGGRAPVALELARVFHRAGHTVFMAESLRGHLSQPSAAVKANFVVPAPRQETGAFLAALKKIVEQNQIELLIPTCEEVFHIAKGLNDLPCHVFTEPLAKLDSFHNKWKFASSASDFGLRVPDTILIQNQDNLMNAYSQWKELVLKPVYSRFASRALILPQLRDVMSKLTFASDWVAQEFIAGQQFCTYSVCQNGQITAHTTYPTIFTAGQGATIAFEHVDHPAIFQWVKTFVERFQVTGQVSFDFIQSEDGQVYALECNPRATSGVHLLASHPQFVESFLGVSVTLRHAQGRHLVTPPGNKRMLASAMLIYGLPSALVDGSFRAWLKTFLHSDDVILDFKDPLPFLLQFRSLLFYLKLAHEKGISLLEASTFDIEWNGEVSD
jgi:predicted ATP-grasp superfamily ATP-dependent carboligase